MTTKRAVIYARVSTDDQAERGFSLPSQVEACQTYADQHGFTVMGIYQDDYSGAKLERPKLDKLRDKLESGEIHAVIVLSSDRLTRNLAHSLILREMFEQHHVELHYVQRGKSDASPEARMLDNIEGVFNEYWREKIVEATRRGLHSKAKRGLVVGMGGALYGYRYKDGTYTIHEPEADIVWQMYTWYLRGDEQHARLSCFGIAVKLNDLKVPPPSVSNNNRRRKRQIPLWSRNVVNDTLSNQTYAGVWKFGKSRNHKSQPEENMIRVPVPCIIDKETWELVQEQKRLKTQSGRKAKRYSYLLSRRIRCDKCGHAMVGAFKNNAASKHEPCAYYQCSHRMEVFVKIEPRCPQKMIRAAAIESCVWSYVIHLLTDDDFEQKLTAAKRMAEQAIQPRIKELELVDKGILSCDEEIKNLVANLAAMKSSGVVAAAMQSRIDELERTHASLMATKSDMERALMPKTVRDEDVAAILAFRKTVMRGLDNPTFEDKLRMLDVLQVSVSVNDYLVEARCRFNSITSQNPLRKLEKDENAGISFVETFDLSDQHGWAIRKRNLQAEKAKRA